MTKGMVYYCSVFIASSMSGWSGCLHRSSWLADRCLLLYSGLTQGQGHTVRHPLLFAFLSQIWLSLFTITIKGFAFLYTVYREKLTKNTVTSLYCETIGYGVPLFNLNPGSMYIIYNAAAGLIAPPSEGCLDGNGKVLVCF